MLGNPPARHRGLPGPSGPEPQRSPKRVRKGVPPWGAPESPKSAPRSPKRVQKRSFGLFLDSFWTPWRTLWGLRGSPGRDTLSDSFRTPLGFQAQMARETSVPGRGFSRQCQYWMCSQKGLSSRAGHFTGSGGSCPWKNREIQQQKAPNRVLYRMHLKMLKAQSRHS